MKILSIAAGLAAVLLVAAAIGRDAGVAALAEWPAAAILAGGTAAGLLLTFPLTVIARAAREVFRSFFDGSGSTERLQEQLRTRVVSSRRRAADLRDELPQSPTRRQSRIHPMIEKAATLLAADGDAEDLEELVNTELSASEERHLSAREVLEFAAMLTPALGVIGTIVGLVRMLRSLDSPAGIGHGLSTALMATLYGAILAYMVLLPLASRIEQHRRRERLTLESMRISLLSLADHRSPATHRPRLSAWAPAVEASPSTRAA